MNNKDKDVSIFLIHILESCAIIEEKTKGVTEEQFHNSTDLQDILIRRIEVIGEAVKHLPREFTANHSEIPWKKIAGMRDVLIHHYFDVDYNLLWATAIAVIPPFKKQVEKLLQSLSK